MSQNCKAIKPIFLLREWISFMQPRNWDLWTEKEMKYLQEPHGCSISEKTLHYFIEISNRQHGARNKLAQLSNTAIIINYRNLEVILFSIISIVCHDKKKPCQYQIKPFKLGLYTHIVSCNLSLKAHDPCSHFSHLFGDHLKHSLTFHEAANYCDFSLCIQLSGKYYLQKTESIQFLWDEKVHPLEP